PVLDVSRTRLNGKPRNGRNGHAETLAEHIARSSPTERLAAARIVGAAELWDSMIEPGVALERAATEANSTTWQYGGARQGRRLSSFELKEERRAPSLARLP